MPEAADRKDARRAGRSVSRTGRFEWHDHRMHWMSKVRRRRSPTPRTPRPTIFDWKVPDHASAARRARSPARCTGRRCRAAALPSRPILDRGAVADRRSASPCSSCAGGARLRRGSPRRPGDAPPLLVAARVARRCSRRSRPLAAAAPAHAHALLEGTVARARRGLRARAGPGGAALQRAGGDRLRRGAGVRRRAASRCSAGEPFHPAGTATTRSRCGCATACPTAATRRPTASCRPTRTPSAAASCSASATGGGAGGQRRRPARRPGRRARSPRSRSPRRARSSTARSRSALGVLAVLLLAWLPALRSAAGAGEGWSAAAAAFAARSPDAAARRRGARARWRRWPRSCCRPRRPRARRCGRRSAGCARCSTRASASCGARRRGLGAAGCCRRPPAAVPALRPATVGAAGPRCPARAVTWALAAPARARAAARASAGTPACRTRSRCCCRPTSLHVLAAGAWIGGLAVLVLALPAATRRLEPARPHAAAGGDRLARFSDARARRGGACCCAGGHRPVAARAAARSTTSGTRAFGRAILVKAALVSALLGLGALNRRRTLPAARAAPRARPPRPAAPACCCGARCAPRSRSASAALAVTGALAGYAPATAAVRRPVLGLGRARPGARRAHRRARPRAGANEIHVYLFDRSDGRQYDAPEGAALRGLAARAGRSSRSSSRPRKAGPGHYVVGAAALVAAGRLAPRARRPHHATSTSSAPPSRSRSNEGGNPHAHDPSWPPPRRRSLLAPAAAQAHVTLQPDTAPAGGFTRLDVRVPNERDDAGTTKVDVQLPPGFIAASYEPVPAGR